MSRIAVFIFFMITASAALAQLPTGTILGEVRDTSGALVPSASLTARNVESGQTRTVVTAGDGSYRFPALPVGSYEVLAEHAGFRTAVHSGLTLEVAQEAVVNFTLDVGAVGQTVSVTAEAPLVNTTSGSLGGMVNEEQVANLPLNGRNYADLTLLQPGINQNISMGTSLLAIGDVFSSNGATIFSNNYLLDGATMQSLFGTTSASSSGSTLGVDAIREYRVVTNGFSAEYGMRMGSQTLIVTKSGTNSFHGTAFEFIRNSSLDAGNYFDTPLSNGGHRLPEFRRNNFGGAIGGPIKKDKTFFFATYEGLRQQQGNTILDNTIPVADRVNGGLVPQIAPVVQPFLQYFPIPNSGTSQFKFVNNVPTNEDYYQGRLDQNFSASDAVFVRVTFDPSNVLSSGTYPTNPFRQITHNMYDTLSENHVFSPALLNTFRFSYSRTLYAQADASTVHLSGPQYSLVQGQEFGNFTIGGLSSGFGPRGSTPQLQKQDYIAWSDDMFYTRGRHALKFGTLINRIQQSITSNSIATRGSVTFANLNSFLLGQPSSYSAGTPGSLLSRGFDWSSVGFYFQDDLRVRSNLTLNLGFRYEFHTTLQETHGNIASLRNPATDPTTTIGPLFVNPSLHNFSPRFGFAWDVMGDGKTAVRGGFGVLYDIAPVGAVLFSGTSVLPFSSTSQISIPSNKPITLTLPLSFPASARSNAMSQLDYHLRQPHMLSYNLTVERQLPQSMVLSLAYAGSRGLDLMAETEGNPIVPGGVPLNGVCVPRPAAQPVNLGFVDGSPSFCWLGTEPRINPNFGTITYHPAAADSWYNSMQLGLLKRISHGLQFQTAYTWSKSIDTNENEAMETFSEGPFPQDPFDRAPERALSGFDITQNWHFNLLYRFPDFTSGPDVMRKFLSGWSTGGIVTVQTGMPFTPAIGTNRSRSGVGGGTNSDRPNITPGYNLANAERGTTKGCPGVAAGQQLGTAALWFDPCAFTIQPAGFIGDAGRNILRGPGLRTMNFSIIKDTALNFLGESGKLEFRAEAFNILNTPNFGTPLLSGTTRAGANSAATVFGGTTATPLATAGVLTVTSTDAREIQFGLKILF